MRTLAPFAFARDVDPELLERFVEKKSGDVQDIGGYRAQVIPAPSSHVLHDRIPDSLLYVIRGAGHLFFLERPDETVRALESVVPAGC